jgi:hypothetical protein
MKDEHKRLRLLLEEVHLLIIASHSLTPIPRTMLNKNNNSKSFHNRSLPLSLPLCLFLISTDGNLQKEGK